MTKLVTGLLMATLVAPVVVAEQKDLEVSIGEAEWLSQGRQRAYDALMPIDLPGLRAAYRTDPGGRLDELERHFIIAIADPPSRNLEATVVIPVAPIVRQLLEVHRKERGASFLSKLVQVSVRRFTIDSVACPVILGRMSALSKINLSLQDDGKVRLDHVVHRISLQWSDGRLVASMHNQNHALVQWAIETHRSLVTCAPK